VGEARWWRRLAGGTLLIRHPLTRCVSGLQDGDTPLLVATKNGNTAIVEALLKAAGVDVNIQSKVLGEVCTSPHPALTSRRIVSTVGAGVLRRGELRWRRPSGVTRLH
jgi:ankyrin repeat protein